jgi:hypothetical protein
VRTFIIGVVRCVVELGLRVLTAVGIMRSRSSGYGMQKVGSERQVYALLIVKLRCRRIQSRPTRSHEIVCWLDVESGSRRLRCTNCCRCESRETLERLVVCHRTAESRGHIPSMSSKSRSEYCVIVVGHAAGGGEELDRSLAGVFCVCVRTRSRWL